MTLLLALSKFISRPWWIVVLVAGLAGGAGYWRGAQQARLVARATLAPRQAECEARQRQQAQATQQVLEAALARQQQLQGANDRLSAQLETTQHALTLKTQQLHRSIAHAVVHDGAAYTGLGPDGLQRYHAALGYPADDNASLSASAGQPAGTATHAAAPVRGVGPEALLHHISDYGAWCLTQQAQLQALNAFYSAQERPRDEP
ncbi:MAG: hypothetical protein ACMX3H_15830 [Sodalis sp. (in: enterobacteria)]|uniref:hypothetical protein n=1 Tax=Sodalis sp. (in: enterobacteria) TaxID=1898979 RepID=UPI0039E696D2